MVAVEEIASTWHNQLKIAIGATPSYSLSSVCTKDTSFIASRDQRRVKLPVDCNYARAVDT